MKKARHMSNVVGFINTSALVGGNAHFGLDDHSGSVSGTPILGVADTR